MPNATPQAGTTRYLCPLECGWHHDVPPPSPIRIAELGTRGLFAEVEQTETSLREHLDTHTTEQFVRTIQGLRREVAQLRRERDKAPGT
ncbi:hypothetical protein [Streptomyces caniscabiei]|uniref:hypothetical protein n=1 Tax=Streptomyces caniscabiei TaxID=2746961 RepID=UPI0029B79900|nr:hypothetical protein [Streptomyces caniscabiei]MDX2948009.1 hypothetical protein [Streptomyces caniscabiei]